MQLRYLQKATLKEAVKIKQKNGSSISEYKDIKDYNFIQQDLTDEVSASIYGADINKMMRIRTPRAELEKYLLPKVNNTSDNISNYFIFIDNVGYRIKAVTKAKIDIDRL